jgi:hypothetical protein
MCIEQLTHYWSDKTFIKQHSTAQHTLRCFNSPQGLVPPAPPSQLVQERDIGGGSSEQHRAVYFPNGHPVACERYYLSVATEFWGRTVQVVCVCRKEREGRVSEYKEWGVKLSCAIWSWTPSDTYVLEPIAHTRTRKSLCKEGQTKDT